MNGYLQFASGDRAGPEVLVVAIDTSSSMNARDFKPSRLRGAKEAFLALVQRKAGHNPRDSVGLVCFASDASIVQSLTPLDDGVSLLEAAVQKLRSSGSTNIRAGLATARGLLGPGSEESSPRAPGFSQRLGSFLRSTLFDGPSSEELETPVPPKRHRRILLLTDGGHNVGRGPESVANALKGGGVTIDIVGIGGSPEAVEEPRLKKLASKNPDGSPRYIFISDTTRLIETFESLAIRPLGKEAA